MVVKNILIAGDSFAAEWPGEYLGWPKMLQEYYNVTNLAQAGVSEYKILKQLKSVDLSKFDSIIVSHTSPSRVHTPQHPLHKEGLHKDCDLIYTDIADRSSLFNSSLRAAQGWFRYHYDDEYQIDMYNLIRKEIRSLLGSYSYISITHTDISTEYAIEHNNINFSNLWKQERGSVNHYTLKGNKEIFNELVDIIQ
jgi:hypothetical protein